MATPEELLQFPRAFLWGTATAAHQVEGANVRSDWWEWEQQAGRIVDGSRSGLACDHYRRFRADFELLAGLHQNSHRLSIEWARIEPRPGEIDREAVAHYRQVLEALHDLGVEPVVTLHHFTNPAWLVHRGGWERPEVVAAFDRYVRVAIGEYGDLVQRWITINEPQVYAYCSYLAGIWPPGKQSFWAAVRVVRHMLQAHARAYRTIHEASPRSDVQVGIAHHMRVFDPYRPVLPLDRWLAAFGNYLFNRCLLAALTDGKLRPPLGHGQVAPELGGTLDFLGLNYYTRDTVGFHPRRPRTFFGEAFPSRAEQSRAGWEIYPEGLYRLLKSLQSFGKPIVITENGVADDEDELRPRFIVGHLIQVYRSIREGVPVQGYLHWSSMDNFEWAQGLGLRFGLIHVDFETQRRTVKPSGWLYADICAAGAVTLRQVQQHLPEAVSSARRLAADLAERDATFSAETSK